MRKKALLAGALSSFEGPWVSLEAGEWLVEPSPDVEIQNGKTVEHGIRYQIVKEESVRGPARIRAVVSPDYDGPGIFLVASQISSNGDSS